MSNFQTVFEKGLGDGILSLSTGLSKLNKGIGGLQQGMSIGIAAAPKVGKTTFVDFAFVINVYLYCLANNFLDKLQIEYFSYEVSRIRKEFKFCSHFMFRDYGVAEFEYRDKMIEMSADYLMGKKIYDDTGQTMEYVKVLPEHQDMVRDIFGKRIIPMFGRYDKYGNKTHKGVINMITARKTPTGMENHLLACANANGRFASPEVYIPNDPEKFLIPITDHARKIEQEKGMNVKQTVDKWLGITTKYRDLINCTPINVIHSNRALSNPDRLRMFGEQIFPTGDDSKDTGNIAEESTVFMTLFNPNDEKYNLEKHFGHDLKLYPNYRSLHITESRDTVCPAHCFFNMFGGVNLFTPLIIEQDDN